MSQDFYVIRDLNRNMILGLDWLKTHNDRIYFDLKCLRINGKHYVNLEEYIHIASTVRMKKTCLIKPQTALICHGKVRENPDLPVGQSYEISQIDRGFIVNQPGLQIINTVSTLAHDRTLPLLIVNNTNKFIKIYRQVIDKAINEMLDADVIRRSRSPWSFPVVIVDKRDGSKRFCVDFRRLNKVTKKNSYPLPLIDDILALLGKAKYFTSLDLKSGYWQVAMDEKDKEKTAFACHKGLFEFNVTPFGLSMHRLFFKSLCLLYYKIVMIFQQHT